MPITGTPDALNLIERAVLWKATQTPTADPIETRFGYYLKWNGSRIMEDRSVLPDSGTTPIPLDMKEDLLGLVKTIVPNPSIVGVGNDSTIIGEATLTTGTITIDKSSDPVVVTKNIASDSGPFKVLNAGVNVFDASQVSTITPKILSYLPLEMTIHKEARLWIWHLGNSGINYNWVNRDGSVGSTSGSCAFDVNYVPLSPVNISPLIDPDQVVKITIEFVVLGVTYTIWVECATPALKPVSIMFLETPGGRSTVSFNEVTGLGFNSSFGTVKRHYDPEVSFADYQKQGGFSIINKNGGASRSFRKVFRAYDEAALHWIDGFFGSTEYHLMHVDTAGAEVWNKFILTGGQLSVDSYSRMAELTASGYLANQIIGQRGVV